FAALGEILARRKATAIVVGYPLRTDGVQGPGSKTGVVDAFAADLKARFGLPVHLEDEAFSSAMAAETLRSRRRPRPGRTARDWAREKGEIDRIAACRILQDWLDREAGARAGGGPAP